MTELINMYQNSNQATPTVTQPDTAQSGQTDTKWSTLCHYEAVPIGLLLIVFQDHPHLLKVNYYGGEEGIYKSDLHV